MRIFNGLVISVFILGCGSESEPQPSNAATPPAEETTEEVAGTEAEGTEAEGTEAEGTEAEGEATPPAPIRVADDGSRIFGSEPDEAMELTALNDLLASPDDFNGQVVKTEGEIAQVCQSMGCWMELRVDEEGPAVRVPMAGHSFFLPRDVSGRQAMVQGTIEVAQLDQATQDHLEAEGAQAAGSTLGIQATSVVVR